MTAETPRALALALDRVRAQAATAELLVEETEVRSLTGRKEAIRGPTLGRAVVARLTVEGGRTASVRSSADDPAALAELIERGLARAREAEADAFEGPPEKMDVASQGLQISDLRQARLDDGDRREIITQNEDALRGALRGGAAASFIYEERVTRRAFASTRGASGLELGTRFTLRGSLRLGSSGHEVTGLVESRRFADVASVPLGADLLKRANAMAPALSRPARALPLVFEPPALARLLPPMIASFDGARVAAGASWVASLDGETPRVGSSRLYLVDDAAQPGALETRAFDDRGVPPMPVPLVREGRLGALYLDPREARRRDMRPTGHARADGALWPGNLMIRPGARSRNMMFPDVGPYLLVAEVLDLSGIDVATGAMTVPVLLCLGELGQIKGTVGLATLRTTIGGFLDGVAELASDTERHGAVDACTWVAEGLPLEWAQ